MHLELLSVLAVAEVWQIQLWSPSPLWPGRTFTCLNHGTRDDENKLQFTQYLHKVTE